MRTQLDSQPSVFLTQAKKQSKTVFNPLPALSFLSLRYASIFYLSENKVFLSESKNVLNTMYLTQHFPVFLFLLVKNYSGQGYGIEYRTKMASARRWSVKNTKWQ